MRAYFLSLEYRGNASDIDFWLIAERELRPRSEFQECGVRAARARSSTGRSTAGCRSAAGLSGWLKLCSGTTCARGGTIVASVRRTVTRPFGRWLTFAGFVLVVAVLYWAQPVLVPIAVAMLMTFVLSPPVTWLQRWIGRCRRCWPWSRLLGDRAVRGGLRRGLADVGARLVSCRATAPTFGRRLPMCGMPAAADRSGASRNLQGDSEGVRGGGEAGRPSRRADDRPVRTGVDAAGVSRRGCSRSSNRHPLQVWSSCSSSSCFSSERNYAVA